jgi:hypothetical protein
MSIQMISKWIKCQALAMAGAAVMASLAFTPSAEAQSQSAEAGSVPNPASVQTIERRVAMLTSHLQLYSGQVVKIRAVLNQEREQMMLRNNVRDSQTARSGPGPRSARSAALPDARVITDRTEREIEKVLDARQLAAYRALKEGKRLPNYLPQNHRASAA